MKKQIIIRTVLVLLLAGFFASCSKENLLKSTIQNSEDIGASSSRSSLLFNQAGGIVGQINPVGTDATLMLYDNQNKAYGPYYPDRSTGSFKMTGLPSGSYKLFIKYPVWGGINEPKIRYKTIILEVLVESKSITDLGVINCL